MLKKLFYVILIIASIPIVHFGNKFAYNYGPYVLHNLKESYNTNGVS